MSKDLTKDLYFYAVAEVSVLYLFPMTQGTDHISCLQTYGASSKSSKIIVSDATYIRSQLGDFAIQRTQGLTEPKQ